MIQSITEKNMTHISIKQLYKKDNNGSETLITKELEVKKETNLHFQTITRSINRKKPIQGHWKEQYKLQPHINENIYSNILDVSAYDEWIDILKHLSNGKASDHLVYLTRC